MKKHLLFSLLLSALLIPAGSGFAGSGHIQAGNRHIQAKNGQTLEDTAEAQPDNKKPRLSLGGYGEVALTRNFYSDNWKRYTDASLYRHADSHGRFDIPHVTFFVGYEFGHGWRMNAEIEFEHGGTESSVEIEEEENGEYESEIERGGEVALEQFWIEKTFCPQANLRMGHIIVPVGLTNGNHLPTEFFGVYRPEGENTIFPCTWHETGISFWGRAKAWRYEAIFIAGLDADRFNEQNWIQGGAGSPYEFKIANSYAGAVRIDNYSIPGLRLGISGYYGHSGNNSLRTADTKNNGNSSSSTNVVKKVNGAVILGCFDFHYHAHNWVARGSIDYGHLGNSAQISYNNKSMPNASPSPKTNVASDAMAAGIEAGYNIFSQTKLKEKQKLYLFGRYDYYDSMLKTDKNIQNNECWERHCMTFGLNYYPIKQIVIKGQYSKRFLRSPYNDEPSISLGVAYSGFFTK